ncbi:MAG TPA: DUF721 domain-containing protein [Armatimonadota bacterium]|nr:DUF721 domain-containing protein [Armatimonadota bacterium]HOJ22181.1 DUF721 domain-containing protein [Armatimonadota bacterium]HOM83787.1 DUF721 domain-containing protein [Armatimonadota bacterium]HPO74876.1 DUF721 domain-containing protein [Armatimonadota bacterium]
MAPRKNRQLGSVGNALDSAFARLGLSGRLAQQRAVTLWPEVVGPQIAASTRAVAVRDGILFVATKSSTWAHELIFRKKAIMEALERELGRGVLADIRFQARGFSDLEEPEEADRLPAPDRSEWSQIALTEADKAMLEEALEGVSDPDLRARLERVWADSVRIRRWKEAHGWARCARCGLPHRGESELCAICRPRGARA